MGDFKGKKLILYFYPKDNTPGCTAEACDLSENYDFWLSKGVDVVGVSPDSTASHQKFIEKYGLRFNLIADTDKKILMDNENWIIEKIFIKVDTKNHTEQIAKEINIK